MPGRLQGLTGTTNGSNVGASLEAGETLILPGFSVGETVWYSWTAPADGAYTFSTTGSDFDSLLGVYTGNSVNALTFVGAGYDILSFAFSQPVTFNALAGTVYSVVVDGYPYGGLPDGNIVLTWTTNASPSAAGDFLFASQATVPQSLMPLYIASESESFAPMSGRMYATAGARLTVTRLKGATGRVLVDYTVTNTFYTNLYTTNIFGTNITMTSTDGSYTNFFTTNIVMSAMYQNNEYGRWVYLPTHVHVTNIVGSNINGVIDMGMTNYTTNIPPVFVCDNFESSRLDYLDR